MHGRIRFPGSPWPGGHAVAAFGWEGRIDRDGRLWFDLRFATADYRDAGPPTAAGDGDWSEPIAWEDHRRCTVEPGRGLLAAEPGRPFRWDAPRTLTADPLPHDVSTEPAFTCYLLGHDAVAGHEVALVPRGGVHDITWTGAVALAYAGDDEFRYAFHAELSGVAVSGIGVPPGTAPDPARAALARVCDPPDRFVLDGDRFVPR